MTASERRNAILEDLCMRRFERINNLAFQYGVTERTIRNDIMILSLEYPIYTAQGNGGGIYVDKNFRLGKVFLKNEQQELLERLLPGLEGKDAEVMKAILKTFGLEGAKNDEESGNGLYDQSQRYAELCEYTEGCFRADSKEIS